MVPRPARAPVGRVTDGYRRSVALRTHLSREYPTLGQHVETNPGMSELLELDDVLESEPPAVSTAEVGDIVQRRFDLSGAVRALSSERDANFRVDTSAGPYLLKITNAAEDPQVTDLQTAALQYLEREAL